MTRQVEQMEILCRAQNDTKSKLSVLEKKHSTLEKDYLKLQTEIADCNMMLRYRDEELEKLNNKVQEHKSIERELDKYRSQMSTLRADRDKAAKDAARSAVAQACLETQKSETDAAKAALHDSLEEIESLYQELEQIACAKDGV